MKIYLNWRLCFAAISLAVMAGWFAIGMGLHRYTTDQTNAVQLQELAEQLIRRAEKVVDFVVIANSELLIAGHAECSPEVQQVLQKLVLDTGTVSDLYMVTADGVCSSFDDLSMQLPASDLRGNWVAARNPAYRFGEIEGRMEQLVGVSWGFGTSLELVAAINADAMLFDVLPTELRNDGRVDLFVGDQKVGSFLGSGAGSLVSDAIGPDTGSFSATGERYPLSAQIMVHRETLETWRRDVTPAIAVAWSLLGLFVSGVAGWASIRGRDENLECLEAALRGGEIVPFFQPIVDLASGKVIGCEALARWLKPDGEQVSPGKFIPLIERNGLDDRLLTVMIEGAARDLGPALQDDDGFYVSFNVTPAQLISQGFCERLLALVSENGLRPGQVCVEVTERQAIASPDQAAAATTRLHNAGFRIAIDDAGTGHNGLAALQVLDASTIKIDKFFVDHIDEDPKSRVMVDMFVSVAKRYDMRTIAEGVETESQMDVLCAAGVSAVQGYVHSPAVPPAEFVSRLQTAWRRNDAVTCQARARARARARVAGLKEPVVAPDGEEIVRTSKPNPEGEIIAAVSVKHPIKQPA
ncbi:MAG: EAL domain-containing protein [Pseudomonadota bacterium]